MRNQARALALLSVIGLLASTLEARSQPVTEEHFQLAVGVAYGLYTGDAAREIPSPYGLGVAARAGYTFEPNVYLGIESNYFFGANRKFPEYGDVEGSLGIVHYGAEAGYDFGFGQGFVLRPKLGLGAARVTAGVRVEGLYGEVTETGLAVTGGMLALFGWEVIFLAAEARYTSLAVSTQALQGIFGTAVQDDAQLSGLLFTAGVGVSF